MYHYEHVPYLRKEEKEELEHKLKLVKDVVKYIEIESINCPEIRCDCITAVLVNDYKPGYLKSYESSFSGLERGRHYTLEELGLFQDQK